MKKLRTILHYHSKHFKYLAISILIYSLINIKYIPYNSKYKQEETKFQGTITKLQISENKLTITIKGTEKLIINYYKEDYQKYFETLTQGMTIQVEGTLIKPKQNTIPNNFNYKKYLYNNQIHYLVNATKITIIKNNTSIITYFKNKLNKHIESKTPKSSAYIKTFVLGDQSLMDKNILKSYRSNGLSHLLSISGLHLSLLIGTIFIIIKKITHRDVISYLICIFIAFAYMLFLNFTPSILRSGIMYILLSINKIYNLKIKSIDLMYLVLIIILLINPFYLVNIGFQLSYIISYFLILTSSKIKHIHNYFNKLLITSIISALVSFPIIIYNFYEINIISIIINLLFIPIISYIVLPLSFISLLIPYLDNILTFITSILEQISIYITKITITKIIFPKPSYLIILIYYLLLLLSIKKYKLILLLIPIIIYSQIKVYIENNLYITMLDVGQGDSIHIKYPHNKLNILVDIGNNNNYDVVSNIITYFKSQNIKKINYLILTHGDYDHIGGSINLVNNFEVENVIFNCGEYNDLEKELIQVLDKKKINYYSCIKELNIDKYKLQFLNTGTYDNENDNSNVIYFNYNNYKFLFMGDAGVQREKDLLEKYNLNNIYFLKVGHHGSNTSSSELFIKSINPKYSLISVGKNNRYGQPKESVLDTLKDCNIYRTDQDGSIEIKLNKSGYKISTCPP